MFGGMGMMIGSCLKGGYHTTALTGIPAIGAGYSGKR